MKSLAEYKKQVALVNWLDAWFITFTIKPEYYSIKACKQLNKSFDAVQAILNICCTQWVCVAELTKASNIHYHAIAFFKEDNSEVFRHVIQDGVKSSKVLGNTKVNDSKILDVDRTMTYLFKDFDTTRTTVNFRGWNKDPYEYEIIAQSSDGNRKVKKAKPFSLTKLLDCNTSSSLDEEDEILAVYKA